MTKWPAAAGVALATSATKPTLSTMEAVYRTNGLGLILIAREAARVFR
jgi:hypothetical protein